jgi:hypothetical protein
MMGALQGSKKHRLGSIKAYLANNASGGIALATIAQTGVTDRTTLAMAQADAAMMKRVQERMALQKKLNPPSPPLSSKLDPTIYFKDGSTLDTVNNIITMANGKKIDAITGTDWIDSKSIINLANGSYLDTANNILTLSNGTKIDTVTGLIISTTA